MSAFSDLLAAGKKLLSQKDFSGALSLYSKLELNVKEHNALNASYETPHRFFYTELMALFILNGDLTGAKYLWKRAPLIVTDESSGSYLREMWAVGKALWIEDTSAAITALTSVDFPTELQSVIAELKRFITISRLSIIGTLYSSFDLQELASELHMESSKLLTLVKDQLGWQSATSEDASVVLYPVPATAVAAVESQGSTLITQQLNSNLAMIEKVTFYTAQLEKKALSIDLSGKASKTGNTQSSSSDSGAARESSTVEVLQSLSSR